MRSFTNLTNFYTSLSQNTSSANSTLGQQMINDTHRYFLQKYFDNERSATTVTAFQTQAYNIPSNVSKIKDVTVTLGTLKYTPKEIFSREEWDKLNVFPYYGDIPNNFFIYNNQMNLWPIPSANSLTFQSQTGNFTVGLTITGATSGATGVISSQVDNGTTGTLSFSTVTGVFVTGEIITDTSTGSATVNAPIGNTITYNYKTRVPDLTYADYSTGTITSMVAGSRAITGAATLWSGTYPLNTDITFLNLFMSVAPSAGGDGQWYQISRFTSATALTLVNPVVNAPNISSSAYTIGQFPLLSEDFHDLLVYRPLTIYFSSVVDNNAKQQEFKSLLDSGLELLAEYAGRKTFNVNLGRRTINANPNLFGQSFG